MSWFTAKVLQIRTEEKSSTVTEKSVFSCKTTTHTETVYYLLVQVEDTEHPRALRGTAKWMPELPLVLVGDTISYTVPRNTPQNGFAQLSIHVNEREQHT